MISPICFSRKDSVMAWMPPAGSSALPRHGLVVCRRLLLAFVLAYVVISFLLGGSPIARWVFWITVSCCSCLVVIPYLSASKWTAQSRWARMLRDLELVGVNIALTL